MSKSSISAILLAILVGAEGFLYFQLQEDYNVLNSDYENFRREYTNLENLHKELTISYHSLNTSYQKTVREHADLQTSYDSLTQSYDRLESRYEELVEAHVKLKNQYDLLQQSHADLQGKHEELNEAYITLQRNYGNLQTEYDLLDQSYTDLQEDYEIEKALTIGNSLESYYDYLRQELGPTGWKQWGSHQKEADFAASLALHDLGRNLWPSLENKYYEDMGNYSYEMARKKIDQIIALIKIEVDDTPTDRIQKILEFIYIHIRYELDVNDIYRAPTETLGFESGDCDDFSILAAALFEASGIDAAFGKFKNENDEYHTMVLVHLKDLTDYNYFHYPSLTHIGLEAGKWIIIEPQLPIDYQGDAWIKQWMLLAAAPLD